MRTFSTIVESQNCFSGGYLTVLRCPFDNYIVADGVVAHVVVVVAVADVVVDVVAAGFAA